MDRCSIVSLDTSRVSDLLQYKELQVWINHQMQAISGGTAVKQLAASVAIVA
jgi:hypothetical protein